jgi:ornithine carrier protein
MEASPDGLARNDFIPAALRAAKDFTFGSIAGMVSKVFEHPFDLTKVRLQSQVLDSTARFSGPIDCLTQTWRKEGLRGLYRGLPAPIVGAMAENASLFLSYSQLQNAIRWTNSLPMSQELSLAQLALAGSGAGAITSFLLTPIELVKCKMQVQMLVTSTSPAVVQSVIGASSTAATATLASLNPRTAQKLPGPISVLTSIIRTTGFRGLWLGHMGTLIREAGGSAAWFSTKEFVASLLRARRSGPLASKKDLVPWESALSGACAGAAFNISFFPADSVKSTMQTEEELRPRGKGIPRPTFVGTFKAMYKAQGIRGLYAGMGITAARSIPSSAIIFLIYDGLNQRFG